MHTPVKFLIAMLLFTLTAAAERADAQDVSADMSRFVIVGDSISAGYQNSCLLETQQPKGFASVLAGRAGVDLPLPLIGPPGAPPCLELVSLDPLLIERSADFPGFRTDPTVAARNLSIPGLRVVDAVKDVPDDDFHGLFGFPLSFLQQQVLLGHQPPGQSQIDVAVSLEPTTIVLWLGSNDTLWAMIGANPAFITDQDAFEAAFDEVITRLANTGATMLVGNIPNVNVVPFVTPAEEVLETLARDTGLPELLLSAILQIFPGDLVTLPGLGLIGEALAAQTPLPHNVVLTAAEAEMIEAATDAFNGYIQAWVDALRADGYPVALVDTSAVLDFVDSNGFVVGGRRLTTDFLGGLFTLDGIHPTNTAHAALANVFIDVLNTEFNAGIRPLSVGNIIAISRTDPLILPGVGRPPFDAHLTSAEVLTSLRFIMDPVAAP